MAVTASRTNRLWAIPGLTRRPHKQHRHPFLGALRSDECNSCFIQLGDDLRIARFVQSSIR